MAQPGKASTVDAPTVAPASTLSQTQSAVDEVDGGAESSAPPAAAQQQLDSSLFDIDPSSAEDFFDRHGSDETFDHPSQQIGAEQGSRGDNGGETDGLINGLHSLHLEDAPAQYVSEDSHVPPRKSEPEDPEHLPVTQPAAQERPAENYEHQGEGTLLEEAVLDDAEAPLVPNTEPATDDWGVSEEVFDLGGSAQEASLSAPQEQSLPTPNAEAVGTTVGDQVIGNTTVGGNTGEELDWGNTAEPDPFSPQVSPTQGGAAGTDASAWDLALDDDFLPENEDGSTPFDLDEDGFLEDESAEQTAQPLQSPTNRYAPQAVQTPATQTVPSPYSPAVPQFTDFSQLNQQQPTATPNVAYGGYGQPAPYQPPRPAPQSSAESFVDKSKGGYHSPYDLPEDVVATRRRPAARPTVSPYGQISQPPSRSASNVYTAPGAPTVRPPPPTSTMSAPSLTPPSSSQSNMATMTGMPPPPKPAPAKSPSSDFFAELPVTIKTKPSGRHTPQSAPMQHPPVQHQPPPPWTPTISPKGTYKLMVIFEK